MPRHSQQAGFTLIESLVAMVIVASVTIAFLGIRTTALIDATRARNWRLAREIAEEKLSELQAGAREFPPESGTEVPIEKYEGFAYKIVIGESAVADVEGEIASEAAGDDSEANDRAAWQRDREDFRRARSRGLSAQEYEDQRYQDVNQRLAENAPKATDFEEVALVVYFPKLEPDYPGQRDILFIKSRVSTLAISGMTPDQAAAIERAQTDSQGSSAAGGSAGGNGGGLPIGGASSGGGGR